MYGLRIYVAAAVFVTWLPWARGEDAPGVVTTLPRAVTPARADAPPTAIPTPDAPPQPQPFIPPQPDLAQPPVSPAQQAFTEPAERLFGFQAEAALLFPRINQRLQAPLRVDNLYSTTATLPSSEMDVAGAIALNLIYNRLGPGTFSATYRLLATESCSWTNDFDPTGTASLRTRLNMNTVDLDYASHTKPLGPLWAFKWNVGARIATAYFDNLAEGPIFERHISNYFYGAGPHAAVALTRALGESGIAVFGRVDGGVLFGQTNQQFSDTVWIQGTPIAFGYAAQSGGRSVPVLTAQFGVSGTPFGGRWGRWQLGYQFEQWWSVGNVNSSTADIMLQGLFGRWTYAY